LRDFQARLKVENDFYCQNIFFSIKNPNKVSERKKVGYEKMARS
jgi:hypothetical protein